jgi:hypothetical protein
MFINSKAITGIVIGSKKVAPIITTSANAPFRPIIMTMAGTEFRGALDAIRTIAIAIPGVTSKCITHAHISAGDPISIHNNAILLTRQRPILSLTVSQSSRTIAKNNIPHITGVSKGLKTLARSGKISATKTLDAIKTVAWRPKNPKKFIIILNFFLDITVILVHS